MMKARYIACLWLLYAAFQILIGTIGTSFAACADNIGWELPGDIIVTAREIGAEKQLCRLVRMIKAGLIPRDAGQEALALQSLNLKVLKAILDIDYTIARIDDEITQLEEMSFVIASKRDNELALVNLGNLTLATGTGAIGASMRVPQSTNLAGSIIGAISGAAAAGFSIAAQQMQEGGKAPLGSTPAMLAQILGRRPDAASKYPDSVWTFLNTPAGETLNGQTRRQALISQWRGVGQLEAPTAYKAALLTANGADNVGLALDEIRDRVAMLSAVRAKVALFKEHLVELTDYLLGFSQND